ncbi:MAG: HPr family phosphocarrier protein [Tepidanaerobacter acetatoxydans]|jgi:phosphocarrier protein HPr|uniref:Phosphocarrier protein HPr n=1 Tax=Tepidanaerobacter acetatoxydans (strain DSM 21804 / JCM 16047 / Re1) TaxID=1209989 RepID=F4LWJ1_TEPAE|nr:MULTISPECIES: HPr family phosphocarrier protein [Tepidanaerobacter]AEE90893.1 Phosphotransferase system, phosphocarrier protein HPr [Tepidanaerobacter acetatoxydans Re1]NLU11265.1 HPr family phosphocarrier protein [Tepidanaerobacter acetatoxydans]CCP25467.1 catabolite repression HPr-like protein [Tepidanaerobacter acetatoxydans Re1]
MFQQNVTVKNKTGLHARPAALFVQTANKFKSEVFIEKDGKKVNAKSIMGVMSLAVSQGTQITISAQGEDEKEAVEKLVELIESKFGED